MRGPIYILVGLVAGVAWLSSTGCDKGAPAAQSNDIPSAQSAAASAATNAATAAIPVYTYEVVNTYPHDPEAFTQGLLYLDGVLYESTGLNGQSSLRKVDLKTGNVLKRVEVPAEYFAEGLALLNGKLFQLTWQNHTGFVYNLESFQLEKKFSYEGEGWGLTTDGHWLILSDGTDQIRFLDPDTFEVKRLIHVSGPGGPLVRLNELEYIKGEIYANIWQTDYVARIDPAPDASPGRLTSRVCWHHRIMRLTPTS